MTALVQNNGAGALHKVNFGANALDGDGRAVCTEMAQKSSIICAV
jgi:hypothetical protein